ncbi:unnamed protein product [Brassicogethes aeneus]|uniref:Uncharacterized protein n=1 Tax=Brassicogethes aeneus TaxID=1431903 RepID=A0A9P0B5H1_BRAAE|nr:unnamed protein product [Brassicogethes aeneus]
MDGTFINNNTKYTVLSDILSQQHLNNMKWSVAILLLFAGACCAEINLQNLPNIPEIDDIAVVKERCDTKGGPGTYDNVKKSIEEMKTCIKGIINIESIKTEVEESKKTGSMDEVFGKYCKKRPEVKACLQKGIDAVKPCLEDTEKEAMNKTLNVIRELGEFICFRDGDRIAMFVAEGGFECIQEHTEGVKNCVNATLKIDPTKFTSLSPNSIPTISIDKSRCDDLSKVQTCVVEELEKCKDSTPANIVDALFRFIKKSACAVEKKHRRSVFKRDITNAITENQMQLKNLMIEKVKMYCDKFGEGQAFQELKDSLTQSRICTGNFLDIFGPQYNTRIPKCYTDTINKIRNCLPEELKYFPSFIVDILFSVTEFLKTNTQHFKLSSTNMVFQQCFISLRQESVKESFLQCINDCELTDVNKEIFTKDVTCKKLNDLTNCASTVMKNTCIPDITLDKFRNGLMAAFTKPCKDV